MSVRVLAVSGSTRPDGRTRRLVLLAAQAAREAGAEVRMLDLAETALPLFVPGEVAQESLDAVRAMRASARWAQGFLLGTPEYHGGMSSALKNWFDYLYAEPAGKLAGVVAVTGGGGGDMSVTAAKNCFHWCHGFTLPFHAAARGTDFDGVELTNERVAERVRRVGVDVVRYAPLVHAAFEEARALGPGVESGFAGLHQPE